MSAMAFRQYPQRKAAEEFHAGGSLRSVHRDARPTDRGQQVYVPPGWPQEVLPPELTDDFRGIPRRIDGVLELPR